MNYVAPCCVELAWFRRDSGGNFVSWNGINAAFTRNPFRFISNPAYAIGGHDELVQATQGTRDSLLAIGSSAWKAGKALVTQIDTVKIISFDFYAYQREDDKMVIMTPVYDNTLYNLLFSQRWYLKSPYSNPIRGYWFPYVVKTPQEHKTARHGGGPPSVMGWVDIPMAAPTYPFAFTGSMQGCHLVVTLSPANPGTHFRVYHYPSPGTYWQTEGNMAFNHWPAATGGRVCAWFDDTMYCHNPPNAVDAFNFLYHDGTHWYIYTQKQERTTHLANGFGIVIFTVKSGTITGPIPTQPLSMGKLFEHANRWRAARQLGHAG